MVRFQFDLTDEEAEFLFDALQDQIFQTKERIMLQSEQTVIDCHKSHIAYIENIKSKMENWSF